MSFDPMYQQGGVQQRRMDADPSRATSRAGYFMIMPGGGALPPPAPALVRAGSARSIAASPTSMSIGSSASPPGVSSGSYASPPPGAAYATAPGVWCFDAYVGPAYVSTYPLTMSSSPPTARQSPATRMINRSSSSSGDSASSLSMALSSAVTPVPPPGFRLVRMTSGPTIVTTAPGSSAKSRGPRTVLSRGKSHSPRKAGRVKGGSDAPDATNAIVQAKASGVSEWHMITADGDDDGPPQPRDPLGPKRFSKYYQ